MTPNHSKLFYYRFNHSLKDLVMLLFIVKSLLLPMFVPEHFSEAQTALQLILA
jgi:hypothetical protein